MSGFLFSTLLWEIFNILLILLIAFILIFGIKLALKLNKALDIYK